MSRFPLRFFLFAWLPAMMLVGAMVLAQSSDSHAQRDSSAHPQGANSQAERDKIINLLRDRFGIPASVKITLSNVGETVYPDFYVITVTVDDGKDKPRSSPLYVSKNMRYLVQGGVFNINGDSRPETLRLISLRDQPSQGPAAAPVTLVEYTDLQCPVCANMHETLENDIVPKYGDKLRLVFKEFPLVSIHDWAMNGAVAAQCVYQVDPTKYADFRSAVYKNQESITAEHSRDLLLHFAAEAGVADGARLAACIDSQATLPRVEADIREAEALGVGQTPTSYINGRILIGGLPAAEISKLIDQALSDKKP